MHRSIEVLAAGAAVMALLATTATAAAPPAPPAAPTAPEPVKWARSIPFSLALKAANAALECGESYGSHLSVGVMDISGHFKVLYTPDNATLVGEHVLVKKMQAALLLQKATSPLFNEVQRPKRAESDVQTQIMDRVVPAFGVISPGAEPLFAGGDFVGVVGVGGATTPGDVDTKCGLAGADAIKDDLK